MPYFSEDFITFFKGLEKNNHKDWFDKNRKTYEKEVKKPFKQLVEDLISFVSEHDPDVYIEPKDAIFRINRDIRFSKDKTPYQTHVSANIAPGGRKSMAPGFYIQLNANKVWIGGGVYFLHKDALEKVRYEIAENTREFRKLIEAPKFKRKFGEIKGEKNKVLPKQFKEDAQKEPLLFNKQFYYMVEIDSSITPTDRLIKTLKDHYLSGFEVNRFFKEAIAVSQ